MKARELLSDRVYTASNMISVLRILISPFIFYWIYMHVKTGEQIYFKLQVAGFVIVVASDFLDGFLARLLKQTSTFGQMLDPIADKISGFIIILALVLYRDFPMWLYVIALIRETIALYVSAHLFSKKDVGVKPNIFGKLCVASMALTFILYAFSIDYSISGYPLKGISISMVLLFYVIGGALYIKTYSGYYIGREK